MEKVNAEISSGNGKIHYLHDSEKALLALIRQRDQSAFRQLYEKYSDRIFALCFRLTGNHAMAEEATQEVFIQIWRKIDKFSGNSTLYTWMHSVASNTTISYIRKQKGWLNKVVSREGKGAGKGTGKSEEETGYPEETWVPGPDMTKLDQLILKLPERARMVFVLHAVEGYRHEDIAKQLNTSTGTSKAQFHRAKNLIKGWLEEDT